AAPRLEALESRLAPAVIQWTSLHNGSFENADAWTVQGSGAHAVPGPDDTVVIPDGLIVNSNANHKVMKLTSAGDLRVKDGTFAVLNTGNRTSFLGELTVAPGARFKVANNTVSLTSGASLSGEIDVEPGAVLELGAGQASVSPFYLRDGVSFPHDGAVRFV